MPYFFVLLLPNLSFCFCFCFCLFVVLFCFVLFLFVCCCLFVCFVLFVCLFVCLFACFFVFSNGFLELKNFRNNDRWTTSLQNKKKMLDDAWELTCSRLKQCNFAFLNFCFQIQRVFLRIAVHMVATCVTTTTSTTIGRVSMVPNSVMVPVTVHRQVMMKYSAVRMIR